MMNRLKFLTFALTGLALAVIPKTAGGSCPPTADTPPTPIHPDFKVKRLPNGKTYLVNEGYVRRVIAEARGSIASDDCATCGIATCAGCTDRQVRADLTSTFDSRVWAEEFKRLFPDSDQDLMHTWFANAIMCGYDHARRQDLSGEQEQEEARQ